MLKFISKYGKKLLLLLGFIVIIIVIVSVTYASSPKLSTESIVANILRIDESVYGSNVFQSDDLDFKLLLDKEVNKDSNHVVYIDFTVGGSKFNNIDNIVYDIALVDLEIDCSLLSPYLKWKLLKNGDIISEGSFDYRFDTITNGRLVLTPIQQDLIDYNEDKSKYDYYEFYMWLSDSCQSDDLMSCIGSEDQSTLVGKEIQGKIEVELYADNKKELVRQPSEKLDINTCKLRSDGNEADN